MIQICLNQAYEVYFQVGPLPYAEYANKFYKTAVKNLYFGTKKRIQLHSYSTRPI